MPTKRTKSFNDLNRCYETSQERHYQEQAEEEDRAEYRRNLTEAIEAMEKALDNIDALGRGFDQLYISINGERWYLKQQLEGLRK